MDPVRWKQIDQLVDAALEVSEELRVNFVTAHAGDDADLRRQVLDLLKAQPEADDFLNRSAMQLAAMAIADDETEISAFAFINKKIATYKIERLLGAGGMGEVYLAFDEKLRRKVALKILPSEFVSNDERVKRFELEARAISSLNHPGIVTIYDVGNFEGVNYIATEFVEGKTLRDLIGGKFKIRNIILNCIQICDALSAAHAEGIIHRDIKPENIMIRKDGYAKILDFGLAKLTDPGELTMRNLAATSKGVIIGTPAYMSPSQISDEKIDHRTDLWSCGVVLYEFLTGKNPFKGANRQETFQAILSKDPAACSSLNPGIPVELDRILSKLLEKDPGMGYQSAADLRADLKRVKREFDSSPSWSGARVSSEGSRIQGRDWAFPIAAVSSSLLVAFSIFYLFLSEPVSALSRWAQAKSTQLTFQAGTEAYPSLSPDGKSIVFAAGPEGSEDVFLLRIGGSKPLNLTPDSPATDTMPVFSPDGEQIAFRSDREPEGIYVMGATGENPRRVLDIGYTPSWSPDGHSLVVATGYQTIPSVTTKSELWVVDVTTGEKKQVSDQYGLQPSWSPDGKLIAFWYNENRGKRIVAMIPATGGEAVTVADSSNTNWNPVWSPDGRGLYYVSDKLGNMAIWRTVIESATGTPIGEPELIPTPSKFNRHITFSADGKRLVYVQTEMRSNLKAAHLDQTQEKLTDEPIWLTRGDFEFASPELSPDGSKFVTRLIRKTQDDIVSLNSDGSGMRDLTNDEPFDRYVRWSPDGKKVAFSSDRSGSYEIWTMNADGTDLRSLTNSDNGPASFPLWSPDGKQLIYDSGTRSYMLDLEDVKLPGTLIPLGEDGGFFRLWDWSPDGTKVAGFYETSAGAGIGIFTIATQRFERITDFNSIPRWLPDSRRVIFEKNGEAMILDTQTKKQRRVFPQIKDKIRNIAVSHDGSLLYYTTAESDSDIWLLDLTTEK